MALEGCIYGRGCNLSIYGREWQHLVAGVFYCPGFMGIDMSGIGTEHTLIRTKNGRDDCGICLCSSHEEMYIGIWCLTYLPDDVPGFLTIVVNTISRSLAVVRVLQALQYFRVTPFKIIAIKQYHIFLIHNSLLAISH